MHGPIHWLIGPPIRLPARYRCHYHHYHHHPYPPFPPVPPVPPHPPCPWPTMDEIDTEIKKVLTDEGLLPVPPSGGKFFYPPDYGRRIVTPITLTPIQGEERLGEFDYEAPENGYVSVVCQVTNVGGGTNALIHLEVHGILVDVSSMHTIPTEYMTTNDLLVEKGTVVKAVFWGRGPTAFSSIFMAFCPLKEVAI